MKNLSKTVIKKGIEESQIYAENKYLRSSVFALENQVLELNEKIQFLRAELLKFEEFEKLKQHLMRTINQQELQITDLQSKVEQLNKVKRVIEEVAEPGVNFNAKVVVFDEVTLINTGYYRTIEPARLAQALTNILLPENKLAHVREQQLLEDIIMEHESKTGLRFDFYDIANIVADFLRRLDQL